MPKTINVLFLAAEADPYIKIGGLGDVASSLSLALRSLASDITGGVKLDVRLAIPLHTVIRTTATTLRPVAVFSLPRLGSEIPVQVFETSLKSMPVYFFAGDPIDASGAVYSSNPIQDNEKYTFFSLAALEFSKHINWQPHIIHANDWHTALATYALLIKRWNGDYRETATVLTVHNLPYMGSDVTQLLSAYGLPLASTDLPEWGRVLPLPLGLWATDAIVAVSPTYAKEILTQGYGAGLQDFLRRRGEAITGILNGIDTQVYDPKTDEALATNYNVERFANRADNKVALQERLGLPKERDTPLLAMVSRMDQQKGVDIAFKALRKLTQISWQAIILGTGDLTLEAEAQRLQNDFPERIRVEIRYDAQLARQVYAGADIFIMPSRYEPCGLSQLIAMRYGCVPIVHAVGGLKDTVKQDETGFLFEKATPKELASVLKDVLSVYADQERWQKLQRNCMNQDFSWAQSAKQYAALYLSLVSRMVIP